MRILTVIPITSSSYVEELTYFSLTDVQLGAIVQVPLGKREVPALVVQSSDAGGMKAALRGGDFTLRRIAAVPPRTLLPASLVQAATTLAQYYATSTGAIISTMVPAAILQSDITLPANNTPTKIYQGSVPEVYALQAPLEDRVAVYKNTVREAFAKGKSILIITPTINAALKLSTQLSKGLKDRVYTLTSKNTKVQQKKTFSALHNSQKPVLLVATARYAMLFRPDLSTVIIEDEAASTYNTLKGPYISTAEYIQSYAQLSLHTLILGATVLSSKTQLALQQGTFSELAPPTTRARSTVRVEIIDMRAKKDLPERKKFSAISEKVHAMIQAALKAEKKIFILAPRRGLAPLTVCRDCKTPVLCETCNTPVTLRKKKDEIREFLCYKCGESKEADTTCGHCNSWRLDTLGIGIELIEEELRKVYKKTYITRVDNQVAKTDPQVQKAITAFEDNGGILLGTQRALPFLEKVDVSIIASLDAMLCVPSFDIDEQVFALILKIKDLTKETLSVQTRMPERSVLLHAKSGDIATFVRGELELRKALKYPPYTVMVKITRTGSKRQIIEDFQAIMQKLEPYGPRVFKQFYQITPSKFALHALLRIKTKDYPSEALTELLKSIQPLFEVKVDVG